MRCATYFCQFRHSAKKAAALENGKYFFKKWFLKCNKVFINFMKKPTVAPISAQNDYNIFLLSRVSEEKSENLEVFEIFWNYGPL